MSRHLIERLDFHVELGGADATLMDGPWLNALLRDELLPAVDAVLGEYDIPGQVLEVGQLHLELGPIARADYRHEVTRRLRAALADRLAHGAVQRASLNDLANRPEAQGAGVVHSHAEQALAHLAGFLRTGRLPWHLRDGGARRHAELFELLLRDDPRGLCELLRQALELDGPARRVVEQFPDALLRELADLRNLPDPADPDPQRRRRTLQAALNGATQLSPLQRLLGFVESGQLSAGTPAAHAALMAQLLDDPDEDLWPALRAALARPHAARRLAEQFALTQLAAIVQGSAGARAAALLALAGELHAALGGADSIGVLRLCWRYLLEAAANESADLRSLRTAIRNALDPTARARWDRHLVAAFLQGDRDGAVPHRDLLERLLELDSAEVRAALLASLRGPGSLASSLRRLSPSAIGLLLALAVEAPIETLPAGTLIELVERYLAAPAPGFDDVVTPLLTVPAHARRLAEALPLRQLRAIVQRRAGARAAELMAMAELLGAGLSGQARWVLLLAAAVAPDPVQHLHQRLLEQAGASARLQAFLGGAHPIGPEAVANYHVALLERLLAAPTPALDAALRATLASADALRRLVRSFPAHLLRAIVQRCAGHHAGALFATMAILPEARRWSAVLDAAVAADPLRRLHLHVAAHADPVERLRFWLDGASGYTLDDQVELLEGLLAAPTPAFDALLLSALAAPDQRQRLAAGSPPHQLRAILRRRAGAHAERLLQLMAVLPESERWPCVLAAAAMPDPLRHLRRYLSARGDPVASLRIWLQEGAQAALDEGMQVELLDSLLAAPTPAFDALLRSALAAPEQRRRLAAALPARQLRAIVARRAGADAPALLALVDAAGSAVPVAARWLTLLDALASPDPLRHLRTHTAARAPAPAAGAAAPSAQARLQRLRAVLCGAPMPAAAQEQQQALLADLLADADAESGLTGMLTVALAEPRQRQRVGQLFADLQLRQVVRLCAPERAARLLAWRDTGTPWPAVLAGLADGGAHDALRTVSAWLGSGQREGAADPATLIGALLEGAEAALAEVLTDALHEQAGRERLAGLCTDTQLRRVLALCLPRDAAPLTAMLPPALDKPLWIAVLAAAASASPRIAVARVVRSRPPPPLPPNVPGRPWFPRDQAPTVAQELIGVHNAGMVLAAPFFPRLFAMLELTEAGRFSSAAAAERAVHLMQFTVTGQGATPEYELTLNKLLCGLPADAPVAAGIDVSEHERATIDGMLGALIDAWTSLGRTSPEGLRQTFLRRGGELDLAGEAWSLQVAPGPFDMLLDRLPWSFSIIKFVWMAQPLHVTWR